MQKIVETIAKALVDHPEKVNVSEVNDEQGVVVRLRVDESDMGRVIGKQGRSAKAIRTLVKAVAMKNGKKVLVDIDVNEASL